MVIHILTKNNETTIKSTIESVISLKSKIVVIDLGSQDKTIKICKSYGCDVISATLQNDYSAIRNSTIEDGWNLYLQPWEILTSGHVALGQLSAETEAYRVRILQGDIITKEVRLWKNKKFQNPVYEAIIDEEAPILDDVFVFAQKNDEDYQENLRIVQNWKKKELTSSEPIYYEAMTYLGLARYKEFTASAEQYLFKEKSGTSTLMLKYYLALIYLYVFKDGGKAYTNILPCLGTAPLMAEFWCLLGDIFYRGGKYEDAKIWYENAIILGSQRLNNDQLPIDIEKYKNYPENMIASCENLLKSSVILGARI